MYLQQKEEQSFIQHFLKRHIFICALKFYSMRVACESRDCLKNVTTQQPDQFYPSPSLAHPNKPIVSSK